jgi:ComF family protein
VVRSLADALLAVLLAPRCAACARLLDRPTLGPVCAGCWNSILPLTPPLCDRCGDPLPSWRVVGLPLGRCARCRRLSRPVSRSRAVGAYDGALRSIVHALKYDGRRSLAKPLGALMKTRGVDILSDADVVVPVPLHPSRRRERGFNQADDLARHIGLPIVVALRRVRRTPAQADLPAAKRHRNVKGAFAPGREIETVSGQIVVLVDDVSTTGATLDACARVLTDSGAREVRALTAARVVTVRR